MKDFRFPIVAVIWAATPKSASFTSPFDDSRMLAPLMSRWIWKFRLEYDISAIKTHFSHVMQVVESLKSFSADEGDLQLGERSSHWKSVLIGQFIKKYSSLQW